MYAEMLQNLSLPMLGPMASGIAPETVFIDMLKSRRIGEKLIAEFDLMERYRVDLIEDALTAIHRHSGFTLLENGLLRVTFEDRDPHMAATILNRMIEMLDELNRELDITRASRMSSFIETQLKKREVTLAAAEDSLNAFQERNQALDIEQQLLVTLELVSALTSDAIALETELEIMEHYTSKTSEEYVRKRLQYDEVVERLASLKVDDEEHPDDMLRSYIPSLDDIPSLALEMLRLKRKVEIESTVYAMLIQEYEKSRMDEARDMSTLQVLDAAEPPNLRSRPRRKLLVLLGGMLGFAWSSMIALIGAAWHENRERSAVIQDVLYPLVSDFRRIFRRR
jgi:uncharacterized protein involved in exopolysaccharide biosynthesis